ncbi:MAG: integrase family protein [Alphaproteobacteria bacterium]|nr:integrase family protein [Alphaproteobacteria bacterium]
MAGRRIRCEISPRALKVAQKAVGCKEIEIADTRVPGLSIRVRPRGAKWCLRGRLLKKQMNWTIASIDKLSIRQARIRAEEAKSLIRRGIDPREWLSDEELGGPIERTGDRSKDGYTYTEAVDLYLEHIKAERRMSTYRDYLGDLKSSRCEGLFDKLLKNIIDEDLLRIRTKAEADGKPYVASKIMASQKRFFEWVVDKKDIFRITESAAEKIKPRRPVLIRKISIPAEGEIEKFFQKIDAQKCSRSIKLACYLTMLTAQRRMTIVSARKSDFVPLEELDRWGHEIPNFGRNLDESYELVSHGAIWRVRPESMKSQRQHDIPLPPRTWAVVEAALKLTEPNCPWLFPQTRRHRADKSSDGHLSESTLTHVFAKAGVGFSPHGCRKIFATYADRDLGFDISDTKLILDHSEGRASDITEAHYISHSALARKWPLMLEFEDLILKSPYLENFPSEILAAPNSGRKRRSSMLNDNSDW